jgi:AICAR transformylase/IMP cyclohydrolase PurH
MHFPFPDCVELAKEAGITAVIQPGGSIKDELVLITATKIKLWYLQELVILNINLFNFARHNFITFNP